MKKIKVLSLILVGLFLVGCVKYEIGTTITSDKQVTFSITAAILEEYADSETELSDTESLEESGYTISDYSEDGYVGNTMSKTFSNIDDISTTTDTTIDLTPIISGEEDLTYLFVKDGNTYKANYTINLAEETDDTDYSEYALSSIIKMTYTVTVPNGTTSNNATSVSEDGNTLTWEIPYGEEVSIQYAFTFAESMISSPYLIMGIFIAAAVIAIIVIFIIGFGNNKKKNNTQNDSVSNNQNVGTMENINGQPMTLSNMNQPISDVTLTSVTAPQMAQTPPVNVAPVEVAPVVEIPTPVSIEPQVNVEPIIPTPVEAKPTEESSISDMDLVQIEPSDNDNKEVI